MSQQIEFDKPLIKSIIEDYKTEIDNREFTLLFHKLAAVDRIVFAGFLLYNKINPFKGFICDPKITSSEFIEDVVSLLYEMLKPGNDVITLNTELTGKNLWQGSYSKTHEMLLPIFEELGLKIWHTEAGEAGEPDYFIGYPSTSKRNIRDLYEDNAYAYDDDEDGNPVPMSFEEWADFYNLEEIQ